MTVAEKKYDACETCGRAGKECDHPSRGRTCPKWEPKPYSPPPLRGKKETVACIGMACQAFRPDSGGRCASPNGCHLNETKASDYVATESEKKETVDVVNSIVSLDERLLADLKRWEKWVSDLEMCDMSDAGCIEGPTEGLIGELECVMLHATPMPEKQEVPEEKVVHVHSLQELNEYVKELFELYQGMNRLYEDMAQRVYKLEHPKFVVPLIEKFDPQSKMKDTYEELARILAKPDTVKDGETVEVTAEENENLKPDTVKQEERPCLLEKCQWYSSKDDICGANIGHDCTRIKPQSKPESEDTVMDFSNALKLLKMGNKIRRVGWKYLYLGLHHGELRYGEGEKWPAPFGNAVGGDDIMATDWMLYFD